MKRILIIMALLGFIMGGCATYQPLGVIYTDVKGPMAAASGPVSYSKIGTAEAQSVIGLIATGDCSIKAAARNGGIKKIKYVDYHVNNILGVIGRYTTTVYGD